MNLEGFKKNKKRSCKGEVRIQYIVFEYSNNNNND